MKIRRIYVVDGRFKVTMQCHVCRGTFLVVPKTTAIVWCPSCGTQGEIDSLSLSAMGWKARKIEK